MIHIPQYTLRKIMSSNFEDIGLAPMFNFEVENDVNLTQFSIIQRIDANRLNQEFNFDINNFDELESLHWGNWPIFVHKITAIGSINSEQNFSSSQHMLDRFYDAIMLFKPWTLVPLLIGPFWIKKFKDKTPQGGLGGGYIPSNHTSINSTQERVTLTQAEVASFQTFFDVLFPILESFKKNDVLNRAILANYWMIKIRQNIKPYDRLIFLVTALEALVSHHENELNYRISHRTASLLGETDDERLSIFLSIKEYYDLRSKVVHGTPKLEVKMYYTWYLQEIVRTLILKFFSLHNSGYTDSGKLLKDLDQSVFNPALRQDIVNKSNRMFGDLSKIVLHGNIHRS